MPLKQKHTPPLILVADDVLPTTVMLERIFEHEGYQVKSVYDGINAIQAAQTLIPDLILLDVNMPGINGFDVLKQLRESPATSTIPTILITAMGELSGVVQGLTLGADDYLRKPFNSQELIARAKSKMKARKLEESLQHRTRELEALLRVNEELSQHLEINDLLDFILYLVMDMVVCDAAAIYHLDDDKFLSDYRIHHKDLTSSTDWDHQSTVEKLIENNAPLMWSSEEPLIDLFENGIVIPMQYGGVTRGFLMVLSDTAIYDENDLRLVKGISRSATLAIRNAELYEIQANYAMHLEDMVKARTQELESAQQMLVRSEKLASVGRLAASIAHEINNPLFPIQINLEGMMEDIQLGNSIGMSEVERTLESVERIRYVVNRLLEFTGNRQVSDEGIQLVDINKLIEDIVSLNRKFFQQEGLTIETMLSPLPNILGHKFQLEHVFMNLSLNAKDAMQRNGVLSFKTWSENEKVFIQVEDNGSGIPEHLIETIFEPFVSTKAHGNGLGLFISYGIIQKHNGTVEVKSQQSVGTRFTLSFPVAQPVSE